MQEPDRAIIEGKRYTLTNWTSNNIFDPTAYGIAPIEYSTANHRGFVCVFEVCGNQLFLHSLVVRGKDDRYPTLNGVDAAPFEADWRWERIYRNVGIPLRYSGVLAFGLDAGTGNPDGCSIGHAFCLWETVRGIEFADGIAVREFDLSDLARTWHRRLWESNHREANAIRELCSGRFGFMRDVHDDRRSIVDRYYAPQFETERTILHDLMTRRQLPGETRDWSVLDAPWVPYAPTACRPVVLNRAYFKQLVEYLEDGKLLRDDAYGVSLALYHVCQMGMPHLAATCDMPTLERLADLLEPAFDARLDESDTPENTRTDVRCRYSPKRIAKLWQLVDSTFAR